jgi:pyridoxine kinase
LTEAARNAASTVLNVVGRTAEQGEYEMQLGGAITALLPASDI